MVAVADLERLLERVFEHTSARIFRSRVQVVQVERQVERTMEAGRTTRGAITVVPSRFRVRIHPADVGDVAAGEGAPEALAGRLADAALAFARRHDYHVAARPTVKLVADPAMERGRVEVDVMDDAPAPAAPVPAVEVSPAVLAPLAPLVPADVAAPAPASTGIRGGGDRTAVFRPPVPEPVRAVLRVTGPVGRERTIEVGGHTVSVGRASDNDLVIPDVRVSRHHGRLQARHGTLVYTDLASTNGSRVNGIRVDEIVLGAGDRLQVGDAVLVVEALPG